jgi:hypothetical protein
MRFETRVLYRKDEVPRVVLTCDLATRNGIETPCSELHRLGVPLVGRYVTVPAAAFDPRLEDYRRIGPRRDNWNLCRSDAIQFALCCPDTLYGLLLVRISQW